MKSKRGGQKARERTVLSGRYRLVHRITNADKNGNPAVWQAEDRTSFLYIKEWPKLSANDDEIRAIWNHEVRSLLRLDGYPKSSEFFAKIREAAVDDQGYYLVLETGTRTLLSRLLENRRRQQWLTNLTTVAARQNIWRGLKRIATALTILHAGGTLHRTLRPEAIFVDEDGRADFRLSGFEWSLRVASSVSGASRSRGSSRGRIRAPELSQLDAQFSFASDWFDFGLLVAQVLGGIDVEGRGRNGLEKVLDDINLHSNFSTREKELFRQLLAVDPMARLREGTSVLQAIDDIVNSARQGSRLRPDKVLYIGVNLNPHSRLLRAIVDVSGRTITFGDTQSQRRFIEEDLHGEVDIVFRSSPEPHYVVHGRKLSYKVERWPGPTTWDVGYCRFPDVLPSRATDVRYTTNCPIRVLFAPDVRNGLNRLRTTSVSWEETFPHTTDDDPLDADQRLMHQFFSVTNQLDAVLTAAQIWPVRIVSSEVTSGRVRLDLSPVEDPAREKLARYLNLQLPPDQMRAIFVRDDVQGERVSEAEYVIEDEGILGRRDQESNISWRFHSYTDNPAGVIYTFTHEDSSAYCPSGTVYLSPRGLAGSSEQLRRRQRAIEALRQHGTLLTALADPGAGKRDTHETLKSSAIADLDLSKQAALGHIWHSQPLFTLQGPPGTGKTELIRRMVAKLLEANPTEQILITAHSHAAVDHTRDLVQQAIDKSSDRLGPLILVRLDAEIGGAAQKAKQMAASIAKSRLFAESPSHIQKKLGLLAQEGLEGASDFRNFQSLVRNAANVIFATSNSRELAGLLEADRRFDWSIIEEAGKAHGFDLAAALQASHRILLIGDQRQLPPFNDKQMDQLLADPARVAGALEAGFEFAPTFIDRAFRDSAKLDQPTFVANCQRWRNMIRFFGALYDSCAANSEEDSVIAQRLEEQHRMHPIIGDMIGACFYPDGFRTAEVAIERFKNEADEFYIEAGSWLPEQRVVFVDVPWVQKQKNAQGELGGKTGGRRYTSPAEVDAVLRILEELRAVEGKTPEIQILSPYKAQVEKIRERVLDRLSAGQLGHLKCFQFVSAGENPIGATVDEFQGNEADIVIVSLVRNNAQPAGSGVGFLADEPRVNVLLSRAKRKLIIVGSWDFFESRVPSDDQMNDAHPLAHIAKVMRHLAAAEEDKTAVRVSPPVTAVRS